MPITLNTQQIKQARRQAAIERMQPDTDLTRLIAGCWQIVAPNWTLKNLNAVNPLRGFEHLPIEEGMIEGAAFFQRADLPQPMREINRHTIKWCQAFFDEGQATIAMPLRHQGFYSAWRKLAVYDDLLHQNKSARLAWLKSLPADPLSAVSVCMGKLGLDADESELFLKLMLTSLPGWAAHVVYRTQWADAAEETHSPVTQIEYLAVRLAITFAVWPQAELLVSWHRQARADIEAAPSPLKDIAIQEEAYRAPLLSKLLQESRVSRADAQVPAAQWVFCIDVRSEPFRRALESQGDYETFGFAGFFGVPIRIKDTVTGESAASCPVLVKPQHDVSQGPAGGEDVAQADRNRLSKLKQIKSWYQSVKYNFTSPFALAEALGPFSGLWMALRTFLPVQTVAARRAVMRRLRPEQPIEPDLESIRFEDQVGYAEKALRMMGLTRDFAPVVFLCGHGSATENNAFGSTLECGACGGRHGADNARVLAAIFNNPDVREALADRDIRIPRLTRFVAAKHNTTTDEVEWYMTPTDRCILDSEQLQRLQVDLFTAREINSERRASQMGGRGGTMSAAAETLRRSRDWAEARPEWGLCRNAAFIVAPRSLTRELDLNGRAFLHSYDWREDKDGSGLTTIMTAPMIVTQWINSQYLFSTLDNVAFGSGSKVTANITGKIGIVQGNGGDLMSGLALQSVMRTDRDTYHQPLRLMTVICAPREAIDRVIRSQQQVRTLLANGWKALACIDPRNGKAYRLRRDLSWEPAEAGSPQQDMAWKN